MFGEDVADAREAILSDVEGQGGVFGITHGLQREFGQARCYNTPLAEANIVGRAVGQAIRGLRPIAEIQFFDYIWPASRSRAMATIRWRSNGTFTCPAVIRCRSAATCVGAIWHSQCGESLFAHVPGLTVVFPSRPRRSRAAPNGHAGRGPCAVLRAQAPAPPALHAADPFPPPEYRIPFARPTFAGRVMTSTLVTWGATVQKSLEAADGGR